MCKCMLIIMCILVVSYINKEKKMTKLAIEWTSVGFFELLQGEKTFM